MAQEGGWGAVGSSSRIEIPARQWRDLAVCGGPSPTVTASRDDAAATAAAAVPPAGYIGAMRTAEERREELKAVWQQARGCTRCPQLAATRTTVVFGSGNADADLMFVGEAPGRQRGQAGPAVRRPGGAAAGQLLGEIGLTRRTSSWRTSSMPASRQPRPAAAGDRRLPGLPVPPARADRAAGRVHARELRHEAAARRPDRHHAPARARGGPRDRAADGAAVPALPPGGGALHAARCWTPCGTDFRASRSCWRSTRRRSPSRPELGAGGARAGGGRRSARRAARAAGAPSQLGLFSSRSARAAARRR